MATRVEKALQRFEEQFAKTFGEGTLQHSSERVKIPFEVIPTGSVALDYVLGVGGFVEGRLVEFWGVDAIGKTTMAILSMVEAQRKHPDKRTAFIDMEQTFDERWARDLGLDLSRNMVFTPDSAEDVADAMKDLVRSGLFSMVVLDSIGAMIPEVEKEKDADEAVVATQAKIVTRMVKIAAVEANKSSTAVILLNQVRANISPYGKATTTGGGFALKHVTTHKLEFKRTGTSAYKTKIDDEEREVGHEVAIKVERNKVAPKGRTAIVNIFFVASERYGPIGIDHVKEVVQVGVRTGVIHRSGAWHTLPGEEKAVQGEDNLIERLRLEPDAVAALREQIIATRAHEVGEQPEDEDG